MAMLEAVFLWCRDRQIFGPSSKEMERLVRSERQRFLETFLGSVADRLLPETVDLMETSLADPESPTGFHTIKGDAWAATLENMLGLADLLALIKKLNLPRDMLTGAGKPWIEQIVRRGGA
ncbi:Tn3 family transposase, partial [Mesorhizobium sp. M4B.F.Ca.ET.089.01.1.1]